jgi:hypothetical protein
MSEYFFMTPSNISPFIICSQEFIMLAYRGGYSKRDPSGLPWLGFSRATIVVDYRARRRRRHGSLEDPKIVNCGSFCTSPSWWYVEWMFDCQRFNKSLNNRHLRNPKRPMIPSAQSVPGIAYDFQRPSETESQEFCF